MATYISILRGVNVGGRNKIQIQDLRMIYENLEFNDVITYIQSGNIIFKTEHKYAEKEISKIIEQAIYENFNLLIQVIIRTKEEMHQLISANPFVSEKGIDIERLHVTLLSEDPEISKIEKLKGINYPPDRFIISGKEIYLYCPNGYGISKLSNNFFENKLKVVATTRNWNTINKLSELAGN